MDAKIQTRILTLLVALAAAMSPLTAPAEPPPAEPEADIDAPPVPESTRVYDIHDLVWPGGIDSNPALGDETRSGLAEQMMSLLAETVDPESWKVNGGKYAMRVEDARLIVTTSDENHGQIKDLFGQLRETPGVQGVRVDCHFLLVDEAFIKDKVASMLAKPGQPNVAGGVARSVSTLRARGIVEAARKVPGAIITPMPPMPLVYWTTSIVLGHDLPIKLPLLPAGKETTEVRRLAGHHMVLKGVNDGTCVTLDLMARSIGFDASAEAAVVDEIEGLVHKTFAVTSDGSFVIAAPLVRSRLKGVLDKTGSDGVARRDVVREPVLPPKDAPPEQLPRYLVVVGTVREMPIPDVAQLVGDRNARSVEASRREMAERDEPLNEGPPPPPRPGEPLPPPVKIPEPDVGSQTWVIDASALLLGPEPEEQAAVARAKRLQRVMARVQEVAGDEKDLPMRELQGRLIMTARRATLMKVSKAVKEMTAELLLEPE